jgi:hypothetical protein
MTSLLEQAQNKFGALQFEVGRHLAQDGCQGTDSKTRVVRYREMMLSALERGQTEMAPRFPRHLIAELFERLCKVATG